MRKLILATVLGAALIAPTGASASFLPHFSLLAKEKTSHESETGFAFRENLLDAANASNSVGRDRGRCEFNEKRRSIRCHVTLYLNGELGGAGSLRVGGTLSRGDHRLQINGGTGDFNGVAGKLTLHDERENSEVLEIDLVR